MLNFTLNKNEKVEQHVRKKTYKSNILRFWIEDDVIPLFGSSSYFILIWFFRYFSSQSFRSF